MVVKELGVRIQSRDCARGNQGRTICAGMHFATATSLHSRNGIVFELSA